MSLKNRDDSFVSPFIERFLKRISQYLYKYLLGSTISPAMALAAAVAGEQRNIWPSGLPILPLKFLFCVERQTSLSPSIPE
jgi:hypothetical protein